jgi:hypothetical protein
MPIKVSTAPVALDAGSLNSGRFIIPSASPAWFSVAYGTGGHGYFDILIFLFDQRTTKQRKRPCCASTGFANQRASSGGNDGIALDDVNYDP